MDSEKRSSAALWQPKAGCKMDEFRSYVNDQCNLKLKNYYHLWKWSVEHYNSFWDLFWKYSNVIYSEPYTNCVDTSKFITDIPTWFDGAKLNYAENILKYNDNRISILTYYEGGSSTKYTYSELNVLVAKYAAAFRSLGVSKGDRVAGYIPNCLEAVVSMLACASIGAIWSSTSPDFGVLGVLNRFQQISPKVIISVDAVRYKGKTFNHLEKVLKVVESMKCIEHVLIIPFVQSAKDISIDNIPNSVFLPDILPIDTPEIKFEQLPFGHPLAILYSSGTTGPPKCIVHGAGGTLLQHTKEHVLHGNMTRDDVLIYFTTTGWMMWNWLVGGLSSGGTIILYDGSPFHPTHHIAWELIEKFRVTILGTSAKWLSEIQHHNACPVNHNISSLHTILSTGSPLTPHQYDFVYNHIKLDVLLGSISGGTDIISCFMGQNWAVPVYRGEIQGANLGMAITCYNEDGQEVFDESGELVCTKPFPCMPVMFWNDKDRSLYNAAYFNKFPGVWSHGDYCIISSQTGGIVMLGRSDATLNPNGVRFGTAELYRILELSFSNEIVDSLAVSQKSKSGDNERVLLFLKMADDRNLDNELRFEIKKAIRSNLSPRHVPQLIMKIKDIPYTISGKKVEVAVAKIISGKSVTDSSMLQNPHALECYRNIEEIVGF